jgi:hypothetical protein
MTHPLLRRGSVGPWLAMAFALFSSGCGGEAGTSGGDGGGSDAASGAQDGGAPVTDGGAVGTDGNPSSCPTTPPGGACTMEGLSCAYHCLGCTCTQGQWSCPGLGCAGGYTACPTTPPTEGSGCSSDGCCTNNLSPCFYGGVGGQNVRDDCTSDVWHIVSPASPPDVDAGPSCGTAGCPSVPPFTSGTGGSCTGSLTCDYGNDGHCSCDGRAWTCTGASPYPGCPSNAPDAGAVCVYPSDPVLGATFGRCAYGDRVCSCTADGWVCC